MSDLTLVGILRQHEDQTDRSAIDGCSCGYSDPRTFPEHLAEAILADPGPLLAALAEAGVLREVYTLARHDPQPSMSGPKVQRAGESPDRRVMERVSDLPLSEGRWVERRYVTEWRPDARP